MKKWKRSIAFVLTLMMLLGSTVGASAVSAYPGKIVIKDRASGETVFGYLHGDEYFSYRTDEEGRVIEEDEWGCLRYVIREEAGYGLGGFLAEKNGDTEPGGTAVMSGEPDLKEELTALRRDIADRTPVMMTMEEDERAQRVETHPEGEYVYGVYEEDALFGKVNPCDTQPEPKEYTARGETIPLLIIRPEYEDVQGVFSDAEWKKAIFDDGLTAYYLEASNGKFTYVPAEETGGTPNDGIVTAKLPILCPWFDYETRDIAAGIYKGTDGKDYVISSTNTLFMYAVAAVEDQVNFASYDRNGDGRIDPTELAILMVMPGNNLSTGTGAENQPGGWPHSSTAYSLWTKEDGEYGWQLYTVQVDGVEVYKYTMSMENMGSDYLLWFILGQWDASEYNYLTKEGTPVMTAVGTACHELGHDLGLMDLYPVGDAVVSQLVHALSLMAQGSWGQKAEGLPGSSPTHIDPYGKYLLNFYEDSPVMQDGQYELAAASDSEHYRFLRIEGDDPQVVYLVENRRFSGFDEGLYYGFRNTDANGIGGVVVWRLDTDVIEKKWNINSVNNEEGHYGIMPLFYRKDGRTDIPFLTTTEGAIDLPDAPRIHLRVLEDGDTALVEVTYDCYKVTFDPNGGSVEETVAFTDGEGRLEQLPVPVRSGSYRFDGWYRDTEAGPEQVTTATAFTMDTQIYAKWHKKSSGGSSSEPLPTPSEPEEETKEEIRKELPFLDVSAGDYFYDAVSWAYGNGITSGAGGTAFGPDQRCSRAQIVTFLWRVAGSPEPERWDNPFRDVSEGDYYYKAVLWALEQGITSGTSPDTFSPDADCTRGQAMTFLYKAAGAPPVERTSAFEDVADGAYYGDAVTWAADRNITSGTGPNRFGPGADCTRGQIISFLYRCFGK